MNAITNGVTSNSSFLNIYPKIPKNNKKYKSAGLCLNTNDPAKAKTIVNGNKYDFLILTTLENNGIVK